MGQMTAHEAIQIILDDIQHYPTSLNHAVHYCKAARSMPIGSEELRVQCLYISGNITHWHHPQAKEVRDILKKEGRVKWLKDKSK